MKQIYKFLMLMAMILAIALPFNLAAQSTCQIKVVGDDLYADGWGGGRLVVMQGGVALDTLELTYYGPQPDSIYVSVTSGSPVSFVWTNADYNDDVTLWIYDANDNLLFTVYGPSAGTLYTLNDPCPPEPTTCQIKVVGDDLYADGWGGGRLVVMQGGVALDTLELTYYGPQPDSIFVSVTSGSPVSFVWTNADYNDDVTLWIYDANDNLLFTVYDPSAGTLYTLNDPCPGAVAPCNQPFALAGSNITNNAAHITWGGTATGFGILWGSTADVASGNGTSLTTTETYLDLTGLTGKTEYTVKLWSICSGSTSDTLSYTFTTYADFITQFPYTTGFEGADSNYWNFVSGGVNNWVIDTATNNGGSHAIYISNNNGISNMYTPNSSCLSFAYATFQLEEGQYRLNFDWKAYGESGWDFLRVAMAPFGTEINTNSYYWRNYGAPGGYTNLDGGQLNMQTSWQNKECTITVPADGNYNIYFVWYNDASGGSQPPAAVDNISVERMCHVPTALTVDSVAPTEITIHWTDHGENEWAILIGDSLIDNVTSNPYTITGLEQYTQYTISVYAICDEGDTSIASSSVSAQTTVSCPWPTGLTASDITTESITVSWTAGGNETAWQVTNGVYDTIDVYDSTFYTFSLLDPNTTYNIRVRSVCGDGDTSLWSTLSVHTACSPVISLPVTYDFEDVTTNYHYCWTKIGPSSYNRVITSSGNKVLKVDGCSACYGTYPDEMYAILPEIDSTYYLIDDLEMTFMAQSSYHPMFEVGVYVANYDTTYFLPVDTVDINLPGNAPYTVSFDGYSGPQGRLAFRFLKTVMATYDAFVNVYIDNVTIREINDCLTPSNLVADVSNPDSVVLSWTENGTANEWQLVIGTPGFNPDTATVITSNDDHYALTNLMGGVTYEAYVRAVCDEGTSDWIYPPTQFAPGIYIMGAGVDTISICSGAIYDDGGPNGEHSTDTSYTLVVYPSTPNSLLAFHGSGNMLSGQIARLYIYDGVGTSGTLLLQNTGSFNIALDTSASGPITIHFESSNELLWDHPGFEIFVNCVDAPDCSPVADLEVSPSPTAALVTWQPGRLGDYSGAIVEYKATTAATWTALPETTGNSAVITGLTPHTDYELRVITDASGYYGCEDTAYFTTKNLACLVPDTTTIVEGIIGQDSSIIAGIPLADYKGNSLCQSIYLAEELHEAGLSNIITSVTFTWTENDMYAKDFSIYMTNTTASEYTVTSSAAWQPTGAAALVYNGTHAVGTVGRVTYQLATPFIWDGTSNICITTTMNQPAGTQHTYTGFDGVCSATVPHANRTMYRFQDNEAFDGTNLAAIAPHERSVYRPNVSFGSYGCQQSSNCAAPVARVVDITATTATVAWAPGNAETSWNVSCRKAGTATWSTPVAVTDTTHTFTGLDPRSIYYFKVENPCTSGTLSATVQASTLCAPITLPYTENFDNWAEHNCWYFFGGSGASNYVWRGTPSNRGNSVGMQGMFGSFGNTSTIAVLPELDTSVAQINQTQLSFYVTHDRGGTPIYAIGVMTEQNNSATFVALDTVTVESDLLQWQYVEVPLNGYTGNGTYAAIKLIGAIGGNSSYDWTYAWIDDLLLEQIPTCQRPDSLMARNATTTSVELAWRERGTATNWIVEYGPRGFELGTGTTVSANSNPFTLTGLPAAYEGEFYVRSVCSATDMGNYSRSSCAFQTTQVPATVPYNYDFEDAAEWANWQTCSNNGTAWYRGTAVADSGSYSLYMSADGGSTYKPYMLNSKTKAAVYRDIDFGPGVNSCTMTFSARAGGSATGNYDGLVALIVDPDMAVLPEDPNMASVQAELGMHLVLSTTNMNSPWGSLDSLDPVATVRLDTTWQNYTAMIDNISGVKRVAFYWYNHATQGRQPDLGEPAAVDNISITYVACPRPVALDTVTVGGTTATLTWAGADSTNYEVAYRISGENWQYVSTTTNSVTLTGLNTHTTYYAWVRKICDGGDTSLFSDFISFTTKMCDEVEMYANYEYDTTLSTRTADDSPIGYSLYEYSYVQTIIDSAVMAQFTGDLTAFGFMPTDAVGAAYFNNMDVYMANVSEDNLSTGFIHPDSNHVFVQVISNGNFNFNGGDINHWVYQPFDTVFAWDGHSNVLFAVNRRDGNWADENHFAAHYMPGNKVRIDYQDYDPYNINTVSGGYTSSTVGDIMFISCGRGCGAPEIDSLTYDYQSATIAISGYGESYDLVYGTDTAAMNDTLTSTTGVFNLSSLTHSTHYFFAVRQQCSSSRTSEWTMGEFTTDDYPCFAPTDLTVEATTYFTATIGWTANGMESAWNIRACTTSDTLLFTATTNPYTMTGLTSGVTYNVQVRGLCGANSDVESEWSEALLVTTEVCAPVDASTVTVSEITTSGAVVSWAPANGSIGYVVYHGLPGFISDEAERENVAAGTTNYTFSGLESETTYELIVFNRCTETLTSNQTDNDRVQFTTLTDTPESIYDVESGTLTLFPNPASSVVTVTVSGFDGEVAVQIVDLNGRTVSELRTQSSELTLDVSELAQGAYFVRVTGSGSTAVRKLIVR